MPVTALDLTDPDSFVGGPPHDFYTYLRNEAPVYWHPSTTLLEPGFWVLTRYADIIATERDVATFSSAAHGALMESQEGSGSELMMLNQDPPQHTRLRNLVARGFTPKVIKSMEPHIAAAASTIVDRVGSSDEPVDFVVDFAAELPLVVIAELLGIPYDDRHKVFDWSNRLVGANDPEYSDTPERGQVAAMELYAYAQSLADARRARPLDDIVTTLVTAELEGEKLSDIEFNVFVLLLAVAGNETTRNLISGGMLTLMHTPDERDRLVADLDGLLPTAVDEMLRWVSPVQYFRRTAIQPGEIRGVEIATGDAVTMWYPAANRDEEVFPEPQRFDVGRSPNAHIAFGGRGPHYCLGASLAKMEIEVMFREILTRLPDMRPAGEVERLRSTLISGIKHMPVTYTPERRTG
ncbi:MAG: cytochrome P450 [Acidimicrobiia bacterium]